MLDRRWFLAAPLLFALGCREGLTEPSVVLGQEFLVKPGETVSIEETGLRVRFDGVRQDSRCPADAFCITVGDAEVALTVLQDGAPGKNVSLHTLPAGREVQLGEWTLALERLDPYPYTNRPISPSDYRATIRVRFSREN